MKTFRYIIRLTIAFIAKFKGVIFLGFFLGVGIFFLFNLLNQLFFSRTNLRIGVTGIYKPDNLPSNYTKMIGRGLTQVNANGEVEPDMAKTWETPDKGKTWIFSVGEEILWQDGKSLITQDLGYKFSDVDIEYPDEKTVIFKLDTPFSPFPHVVSKPVFRKGLLGTGDWKVDKISLSSSHVQKLVLKNKEKNTITFKFFPTEETAKQAFKLGQVDRIESIIDSTPFDNWKTVNIEETANGSSIVTIFLNTKDKYLSDKSLRQALNYAINKDLLPGKRSIGPISPDSWAYNPQVKLYNYDPQKAKQILDELPKEIRDDLLINLASTPVLLPIAEQIVSDWKEVGINANVLVSSIIPTEFQSYLAIFDTPSDPDQYPIWHSTQSATNISNYQNPRIDKLLEDGRSELDIEERRIIYLDFQRFLVEDSPAIFLYHPVFYNIERK